MTPTFKEYVFDFEDLKLIGAICGKCGAETILNVSDGFHGFSKFCPFCEENFDPVFKDALKSFYEAYKRFTDKSYKAKARIRIRREIDKAEF